MAVHLEKIKNIITSKSNKLNNVSTVFLNPEVGFKLLHNSITKELKAIVIGGRHFPSLYGLNRVHGYIIKVKVFPGREKFETELRSESWPLYNQEFTFHLDSFSPDAEAQLNGKFLVLTAYAILENKELNTPNDNCIEPVTPFDITTETLKKYKRKLSNFFENKTDQSKSKVNGDSSSNQIRPKSLDSAYTRRESCMTFEKRRTIGSITFSIQPDLFLIPSHNFTKMTGEIWKNLEDLNASSPTSEVNNLKPITEKKGDVEVGLLYKKFDDGERCLFVFSLSKMRCSLQIMQRQEHLNGYLYLKLRIYNGDNIIVKGKTEQFTPSISHKFEPKTSNIQATFNISDLENISFEMLLLCKTKTGKKTTLGNINLTSKSKTCYLIQWEKALENPGETITMWQPLE